MKKANKVTGEALKNYSDQQVLVARSFMRKYKNEHNNIPYMDVYREELKREISLSAVQQDYVNGNIQDIDMVKVLLATIQKFYEENKDLKASRKYYKNQAEDAEQDLAKWTDDNEPKKKSLLARILGL